jgi:hypothetical protein
MTARCFLVLIATLACTLPAQSRELQDLNVKAICQSEYRVGSRRDDRALGGFASSKNDPKPMTWANPGEDGALILVAVPQAVVPYEYRYSGMLLRLFNWTDEEVAFRATDSRLRIVQEALDSEGCWRPIERTPSSFCGNSYHEVFLPSNHYWELVAPRYSGPMQTRLRFVLKGTPALVSNEFEGSINPGQFRGMARNR